MSTSVYSTSTISLAPESTISTMPTLPSPDASVQTVQTAQTAQTANTMQSDILRDSRGRLKIEKSPEEFKEHERILMGKRTDELNSAVTKKMHLLWNQFLKITKPTTLRMKFEYAQLPDYLAVCDNYIASQHKDSKQKWWNNQKASEMSNGFLPAALNATDQMAQYLGCQMEIPLRDKFTRYCTFELLETAITAVFSTQRSGSNEVFARTSFQYKKSNLRKKLDTYFSAREFKEYGKGLVVRRDKDPFCKKKSWCVVVKRKKGQLLRDFELQRNLVEGRYNAPSIQGNVCNSQCAGESIHSIQNMDHCNSSMSTCTPSCVATVAPSVHDMVTNHGQNTYSMLPTSVNSNVPYNGVGTCISNPIQVDIPYDNMNQFGQAGQAGQCNSYTVQPVQPVQPLPIQHNYRQSVCAQRHHPFAPKMEYNQYNQYQEGQQTHHPEFGYGPHRMNVCTGCDTKQREIDRLQRENARLVQENQQLQRERDNKLVYSQTSTSTFAFPFDTTACGQSVLPSLQ